MSLPRLKPLLVLPALLSLPGCLATQSGSLEVLNPKQSYGQSLTVVYDLQRENEAIEKRLASDLQNALAKRGLTIAEDPAKADLVVVPTLGRMRERTPDTATPMTDAAPADSGATAEVSEPVIAAPVPETRSFNRFSSANLITRSDLVSRRAVPSARVPANAQQAGLLLTAYRTEDYRDYGIGRQSLPPVWRIYVSQPTVQMKWKSVAVPLINAAASAAAPLGKGQEHGAGGGELGEKKEEPAAESREKKNTDQRTKSRQYGETAEQQSNNKPEA